MQFENRPTRPTPLEERIAQRRRTARKTTRKIRRTRPISRESGTPHEQPTLARLHRTLLVLGVLIVLGISSTQMLFAPDDPQVDALVLPNAPTAIPVLPTVTPATLPDAVVPPLDSAFPEGTTAQDGLPSAPRRSSDQELRAALNAYMNDLTSQNRFSGAVLVSRGGTILLNRGYGMADSVHGIPNTPQTRFRLASLTKPLTAMGIIILHAQGQLDVQDPICTYLQNCPPAWEPVTIRHLLTHTSGIPNYTSFVDFETTEMLPTTTDQLVARFRDMPLSTPAGERYIYSNSGYVLLGLIIEQVSGQSYEDFMRSHIFEPLQMENTGYDHNSDTIQDQAIGYTQVGTPGSFLNASTLYASGALYSTVEDMYRWDQALYTEYLVPRPLLDEVFTPARGEYGYGWWVTSAFGRRAISHTGLITGFSNYIVRFPDERVCVIVLSNLQSSPSEIIGDHLAKMVFDAQ